MSCCCCINFWSNIRPYVNKAQRFFSAWNRLRRGEKKKERVWQFKQNQKLNHNTSIWRECKRERKLKIWNWYWNISIVLSVSFKPYVTLFVKWASSTLYGRKYIYMYARLMTSHQNQWSRQFDQLWWWWLWFFFDELKCLFVRLYVCVYIMVVPLLFRSLTHSENPTVIILKCLFIHA